MRHKILLVCLKADFGESGIEKYNPNGEFINPSWEYMNLYLAWKQLADEGFIELNTHWVDQQSDHKGLERLLSLARQSDIVWQCPVTHALGIHLPQARQIIEGGTPIVSYHPDAHMRYKHASGDGFVHSRVTEGYDTHTITPARHMMEIFKADGVKACCVPFGIPSWCDRQDIEQKYDVAFVGQKHGIREQVVSQLRGAGIKVDTWGHFWPAHRDHHGRPTGSQMVEIFNQSKVNLNLRWVSRDPNHGQIKGRDFELLGCGAFMVASQHVECDDLHELYSPVSEFAEYHFVDEMIEGIKAHLEDDIGRNAIAFNAYQKREANLWTTRFKKFLKEWGTW